MDRSITLHIFYWNDPYDMSCLHLYLGFGALSWGVGGLRVCGFEGFEGWRVRGLEGLRV